MSKHTPGPWDVIQYGFDSNVYKIMAVGVTPGTEAEANARLIASSPDLLEALEFAVARVTLANDEGNPILSAWLPVARAAIAKAKGE